MNTEKHLRFDQFELSPTLLEALNDLGLATMTTVQAESIPPMLAWRDVIVQAPTGTGKTFAYGIPILEHCPATEKELRALILAPTRELVQQIREELSHLAVHRPELRVSAVYGGESIRRQLAELRENPQILVATPGRLIDLMKHSHLQLQSLHTVILDEADRMLDMGFIDDVRYILDHTPHGVHMGLYSATLSRDVLDISWIYQRDPEEIVVAAVAEDKPPIREYYLVANGGERILAIADLLKHFAASHALIFVNQKQSADIAARKLKKAGFAAAALQGDLSQKERNRVMRDFREGAVDLLCATDVAARGLDIDDVDIVFNYDIPLEKENYIHRIGRTGRARHQGVAVSFVAPGEEASFELFCRQLRIQPERFPWERPVRTSSFLSAGAEEKMVAQIRAESAYLRNTAEEERYDPCRRRDPGQGHRRSGRAFGERASRTFRRGPGGARRRSSGAPQNGASRHNAGEREERRQHTRQHSF